MELKPGYKQTEVGVIPEEWESATVDSVAAPVRNAIVGGPFGSDLVSQDYVDDGVPVIRGQNLGSRWIEGPFAFVTPKKADSLAANLARPGDVVFTQRGTLGQVSLVPERPYGRYLVSQSQMKVTLDRDLVDAEFFHWLFSGEFQQHQIRENTIQTGVPHINLGILRRVLIPRPPLPEQRAIARALGDVDALLGALTQLIAKKRDLKEAAMQQLLTGQTRLPGFSGEWEVKRLGEISEIAMGRTPRRFNSAYWGRGHKWLSIADLQSKVVVESSEEITKLAASEMTIVPKGTLLMSFKLSIGRVCFAGCDLFTNEAICSFLKLRADAEYLYYALGRTDFSRYGKQAVKGYTLNKESLKLVEVRLPGLPEQTAIAAVLSDMDAELAGLEQRLAKTRAIKQGMMQELLTGRTRLV
jgi:type I restriction enzyme S subunit